jgi:hypothetical protein
MNLLLMFIRFRTIDIRVVRSLCCAMRWMALIALAALSGETLVSAQTDQVAPKPTKTPTQLPRPRAEPEGGGTFAGPPPGTPEPPSAEEVGPVQKHFIRASQTDNLAATQLTDNATLAMPEKIALDKRVSIPLIHDVQNDGINSGKSGDNHSLAFELAYLNWGAVTAEQLQAREGHYFTNTWVNHGPKADFVVRFEYRQVKSKEIIRTLTENMPQVSGAVRSYFAVVDKAYHAYGPVVSWRFSILRGDTVVAEAKSFIW